MKYITTIIAALLLSSVASAQVPMVVVGKNNIGTMNAWVKIEHIDTDGTVLAMTQGNTSNYVLGSFYESLAIGSKIVVTVNRLRKDGEHLFTYTFIQNGGYWESTSGDNIRVYTEREFLETSDLVMMYAYDY